MTCGTCKHSKPTGKKDGNGMPIFTCDLIKGFVKYECFHFEYKEKEEIKKRM